MITNANKVPQISRLKNEEGEMFVQLCLMRLIMEFLEDVNLVRSMNENQVSRLASKLMSEYWHYRVTDFILFFENCSMGYYGKFFEGVDSVKIFEMLRQYDQEKDDERNVIHLERKNKHLKRPEGTIMKIVDNFNEKSELEKQKRARLRYNYEKMMKDDQTK